MLGAVYVSFFTPRLLDEDDLATARAIFRQCGLALDRAQLFEGGRLVVSYLLRNDFPEVGAEEPYSEGIVDYLRSVEGSDMVALIREPPRGEGPARRVSLRSSHDEVDVSAIARQVGGGGHRQAAGFSSEREIGEIIDFLHRAFVAATGDAAAGS
jgi:phosphoesterase RecJ-like protein